MYPKILNNYIFNEFLKSLIITLILIIVAFNIKEKGNIIGITNNRKDTSYKILLCGKKNDNLRLNINNTSIKNLSSYTYNNSCYTLVEAPSYKETTDMYEVKLFIPASSLISDYYASYELKVQENN